MTQLWSFIVRFPIMVGVALILAQTLPFLDSRWLWFSDEVRYAEVYSNLVEQGHWIVLNLNGVAYPDKPPVYFLFLALLDLIPGVHMPDVMWLGSAGSAIILLFAMRSLARAVGVGQEGFAAGILVQLCLFGMIILLHYVRMDLLFVAFMLAGQAQLHRHYYSGEPSKHAYLGFALGGVAVLVKGPLGLLLPLVAVWGTALWAGKGGRIVRLPTLVGLIVSIVLMASWAVGIVAVEGWSFFRDQIIGKQVLERATDTFHHSEPLSFYFILLPLLLLPWTGMAAALPWRSFMQWPTKIWTQRSELGPVGILAIGSFLHFAMLSSLDGKVGVYLLPILVQLSLMIGALIVARPLLRGWVGVAVMVAMFGGALIALSFTKEAVEYQTGAAICGAFLVLAGIVMFTLRNGKRSMLIFLSGAMLIWSMLLAAFLLPGLNNSTSTRVPAEHLGRLAQEGYVPVAYRTYPGIFSYYAGRDVVQIDNADELKQLLKSKRRVVVATRDKDLKDIDLEDFETIYSRALNGAGGRYVVTRRD